MAVAPLNLLPEHQAWFSNGLNFLLLDEPLADVMAAFGRQSAASAPGSAGNAAGDTAGSATAALRRSAAGTAPVTPAQAGRAQEPSSAAGSPGSSGSHGSHGTVGGATGAAGSGFARPGQNAAAEGASRSMPQAATRMRDDLPPVQQRREYEFVPANLSAAWQSVMQKVNPGPVVWIYPELGLDLLGQSGDEGAQRSAALRSIIGSLKLKKGTNSFWPVSVEGFADSRNGKVERDVFHGGLDYLGAKYLIVFGASALRGTDFESLPLRPFSEQVCQGRLIISLPDFAELVSDNRLDAARLQSVTVFLHSVFSRVFLI